MDQRNFTDMSCNSRIIKLTENQADRWTANMTRVFKVFLVVLLELFVLKSIPTSVAIDIQEWIISNDAVLSIIGAVKGSTCVTSQVTMAYYRRGGPRGSFQQLEDEYTRLCANPMNDLWETMKNESQTEVPPSVCVWDFLKSASDDTAFVTGPILEMTDFLPECSTWLKDKQNREHLVAAIGALYDNKAVILAIGDSGVQDC